MSSFTFGVVVSHAISKRVGSVPSQRQNIGKGSKDEILPESKTFRHVSNIAVVVTAMFFVDPDVLLAYISV